VTAKGEIELPAGWEWQDDWQVDLNRAVDEYGKCEWLLPKIIYK